MRIVEGAIPSFWEYFRPWARTGGGPGTAGAFRAAGTGMVWEPLRRGEVFWNHSEVHHSRQRYVRVWNVVRDVECRACCGVATRCVLAAQYAL